MSKKDQIKLINENGEEKIYNIVLTFDNEKLGKTYVIYTDGTEDSDGNVQLYAARYNSSDDVPVFEKIEDQKEWDIINIVVKTMKEEVVYS